jgi:hypothetical protein
MEIIPPESGVPLPYAKEWRAAHHLDAIKCAIFITGLVISVLPIIPTIWFLLRFPGGGLRIVLTLISTVAHLALLVGSILGLLQVRAGRWVTIVSLFAVCGSSALGFLMLTIPAVQPSVSRMGSAANLYYLNYSTTTIYLVAYSTVATVGLLRRA